MSARDRILNLFLENIGNVVSKGQISKVANISEWARRVRELRDEYGYEIKSHKQMNGKLRPGEYILENPIPNLKAKERKISKSQYFRILNRDNHYCLSCGRGPNEEHPTDIKKRIKLVVDHVYPISNAAKYNVDPYGDENLQTLCDFCNEGKWNKYSGAIGKSKHNLTALVRHASSKEQKEVFDMLKKIFS